MNEGKLIFSQLLYFLPKREFRRLVEKYNGDKGIITFSCWDQFLCMAFAQLTYRESLRDIEICLNAFDKKLYHAGIKGNISRSTLAYANNKRNWKLYHDFAQVLIKEAKKLYIDEPFGVELDETVYALDASIITLCLSIFPWAKYSKQKAGIKMHTQIDLRGNIPVFIDITEAKTSDVSVFDDLILESGAIYIMDRGYVDFKRLYRFVEECCFFVIRAKKDIVFRRVCSNPHEKGTGVCSDQTIILTSRDSKKNYPAKLRRIRYFDKEQKRFFVFLTNNFELPAKTIADLYKCRWQIEIFFKWIKQHLRIKVFFGTSENAVKTQIWIAISIYVLVAIIKKKLKITKSLYNILQVLSVSLFEKMPIFTVFEDTDHARAHDMQGKQLKLL